MMDEKRQVKTTEKHAGFRWVLGDAPTHAELIRADLEVGEGDSILYHGADWPIKLEHKVLLAATPDLLNAHHSISDEATYGDDYDAGQLRQIIDEVRGIALAAIAQTTT